MSRDPKQLELPLVAPTPLEQELAAKYQENVDGTDTCWTCEGEGVITIDHFTPSRGHWTSERPCPRCRR